MRALAIDTSTHRGQIALWDGGACVAHEQSVDALHHAESVFGLIDRAFAASGWQKCGLDLVVCCLGPGSFTGVRIGLATAKGIALALDRPIVGVSGLLAMASAAGEADAVLALLDARKGEVFWEALGPGGRTLGGPGHVAIARVDNLVDDLIDAVSSKDVVIVGEVARTIEMRPHLGARLHRSPETDLPDGAEIARLGVSRHQSQGPDDLGALEPIYLRPPDITLPRPK
jgi:tRNA threonylcarbamoyladenosine biosynthesis protein TsaB